MLPGIPTALNRITQVRAGLLVIMNYGTLVLLIKYNYNKKRCVSLRPSPTPPEWRIRNFFKSLISKKKVELSPLPYSPGVARPTTLAFSYTSN